MFDFNNLPVDKAHWSLGVFFDRGFIVIREVSTEINVQMKNISYVCTLLFTEFSNWLFM